MRNRHGARLILRIEHWKPKAERGSMAMNETNVWWRLGHRRSTFFLSSTCSFPSCIPSLQREWAAPVIECAFLVFEQVVLLPQVFGVSGLSLSAHVLGANSQQANTIVTYSLHFRCHLYDCQDKTGACLQLATPIRIQRME